MLTIDVIFPHGIVSRDLGMLKAQWSVLMCLWLSLNHYIFPFPYCYKENTFLQRFLRNLPNKFIPVLFIVEVDRKGRWYKVFAEVFLALHFEIIKMNCLSIKNNASTMI
jgi:hypothetical protein